MEIHSSDEYKSTGYIWLVNIMKYTSDDTFPIGLFLKHTVNWIIQAFVLSKRSDCKTLQDSFVVNSAPWCMYSFTVASFSVPRYYFWCLARQPHMEGQLTFVFCRFTTRPTASKSFWVICLFGLVSQQPCLIQERYHRQTVTDIWSQYQAYVKYHVLHAWLQS